MYLVPREEVPSTQTGEKYRQPREEESTQDSVPREEECSINLYYSCLLTVLHSFHLRGGKDKMLDYTALGISPREIIDLTH